MPAQISTLTALEMLYFWNNRLTGTIPAQISALVQVTEVYDLNPFFGCPCEIAAMYVFASF